MQGLRPRAQLFWRRVAIVGDDIVRDRQPACPRSLCRHDTPYGRLRQPLRDCTRAICVAGSQSTTQMRSTRGRQRGSDSTSNGTTNTR